MIGVCQGMIDGSYRRGHRSMLVHPSRRTSSHFETYNHISSALTLWQHILRLPEGDPDRDEFLVMFRAAYDRIKLTVPEIAPFDDVVSVLRRALRHTEIEEVNARRGSTPEIEWQNSYAWILVGGQAMDRGFTVEGLTVTYMPRGAGVGNADVIQQRGRFFGYKGDYLGYCRIYLEQEVLGAFASYVEHEEHMRNSLKEFQLSGDSLNEWKRLFVLSPELKPCRDSVIEHGYLRPRLRQGWITAEATQYDYERLATCHSIIDRFANQYLQQGKVTDFDAPPSQKHYVSHSIPLKFVISDLLTPCFEPCTE